MKIIKKINTGSCGDHDDEPLLQKREDINLERNAYGQAYSHVTLKMKNDTVNILENIFATQNNKGGKRVAYRPNQRIGYL
ncbi:hypothetical protein [Clostridium tagluense]|uniref:Uncharacterized protein n=1 Tax=Clostridium tagluense TaxID=360422 RepID=A0A401UGT7_9CLOT|nr:hypothetical protein [Clostridium tagluense]GCD08699.1 hypothetical protein Ctaglu_03220 [Clostridium tagluense]